MYIIKKRDFGLMAYTWLTLTILIISQNIFILQIFTKHGLLWTVSTNTQNNFFNLKNSFVKNMLLTKQSLLSFYNAWLCSKSYIKLKGLGFSFKYIFTITPFLILFLGFSVPTYVRLAKTIQFNRAPKNKKNVFLISGFQREELLYFILFLKKIKQPDPYKLKGVRHVGEHIKLKEGKKKK